MAVEKVDFPAPAGPNTSTPVRDIMMVSSTGGDFCNNFHDECAQWRWCGCWCGSGTIGPRVGGARSR